MDQDLYSLPQSPEEKAQVSFDMAIKSAFDALDEIMAFGADPKTREMVQRETIMLGQIKSRLEWIGTFIATAEAAKEKLGKLRLVRNG